MRSFCSVALLFISCVVFAGSCWAVEPQAAAGTKLTSVSTLLKPDGSLDLSTGFSGSLDVKGYRMVTGANGAPRFVSSAAAQPESANAVPGPESDADDVYWDDQFCLPGINGTLDAIAVDGTGNIYIGGYFTAVGNMPANCIAKWNGSSWSELGAGMDGAVTELAVCGSDVYAVGSFITAGGVSANHIAKWNGSSWSALGSGMDNIVYAVAVSGSEVYAGGGFITAGGVSANYIAKWDGSSWSALGSGMNDVVYALAVSGSDVYAGGLFATAGGVSATRIAKWDGSSWSALGSGMNDAVHALAVSGSDVYAGGDFSTAGGVRATRIAKWDGSSWSALGSGMNGPVYALAVSGSEVYAGGGIHHRRWCERQLYRQMERFVVVGAGQRGVFHCLGVCFKRERCLYPFKHSAPSL